MTAGGARPQPTGTRRPDVNLERWSRKNYVREYANRTLRPVEALILARHREALSGRVLEVGCGAGRFSGYLAEFAAELHGIDVSEPMIAYCRQRYPAAHFAVGDMRYLDPAWEGSFDVVVAPSNVLDAVGDADRNTALEGFRRALVPDGLLIMSSHNLAFAPRVHGPVRDAVEQLRLRNMRALARAVPNLPRRMVNHLRMRRHEASAEDHALLNDRAHHYSLVHYYIGVEQQRRQLAEHGLELRECLDLDGSRLEPGEERADCPELHYVAGCSPSARP